MKELTAESLMKAYNEKYTPKVSLDDVRHFLESHAFFCMKAELAARIMYEIKNKGELL